MKQILKKDYIVMVMTDDWTNINSVKAYTVIGAIREDGWAKRQAVEFCEFDKFKLQELKWNQNERHDDHLGDVYVIEPRDDDVGIVRYYEIIGVHNTYIEDD